MKALIKMFVGFGCVAVLAMPSFAQAKAATGKSRQVTGVGAKHTTRYVDGGTGNSGLYTTNRPTGGYYGNSPNNITLRISNEIDRLRANPDPRLRAQIAAAQKGDTLIQAKLRVSGQSW